MGYPRKSKQALGKDKRMVKCIHCEYEMRTGVKIGEIWTCSNCKRHST